MAHFRFQSLEIWHEAVELALRLFEIADRLREQKLFRFADQTYGAGMGMPNNIAESTGTDMTGGQQQLLRYARRECFEAANILVMLHRKAGALLLFPLRGISRDPEDLPLTGAR